jgi:hypothetical protein
VLAVELSSGLIVNGRNIIGSNCRMVVSRIFRKLPFGRRRHDGLDLALSLRHPDLEECIPGPRRSEDAIPSCAYSPQAFPSLLCQKIPKRDLFAPLFIASENSEGDLASTGSLGWNSRPALHSPTSWCE